MYIIIDINLYFINIIMIESSLQVYDIEQCFTAVIWGVILSYVKCSFVYRLASAIGSKTAMYNVDKDGDPNANFNPKTEETELQYFIKWKNWSHLHNTWESEAGLRDQKVNGLKKLENFIKKEEDLDRWWAADSVFLTICLLDFLLFVWIWSD